MGCGCGLGTVIPNIKVVPKITAVPASTGPNPLVLAAASLGVVTLAAVAIVLTRRHPEAMEAVANRRCRRRSTRRSRRKAVDHRRRILQAKRRRYPGISMSEARWLIDHGGLNSGSYSN